MNIANQQNLGFAAPKSPPNQSIANRDRSPGNRKTPAGDLGEAQKIAVAGETIPILFGKRVSGNGGVWIQPPLARSGSYNFRGRFYFPVSQGEIVSTPVKHRTWVGLRNLAFLPDQTITLLNVYDSAATLEASPSTCPISAAGLYCGVDSYTYITTVLPDQKYIERLEGAGTLYSGARTIARGTGDTSNSAFKYTLEVFDNVTGADLTSAFFAAAGVPSNTEFVYNVIDITDPTYGCGLVDTVVDLISDPNYGVGYQQAWAFWNSFSSGSVTQVFTYKSQTSQYFPGNPASTGTLTAVQQEAVISKYPDPDITPTADNSAYADITFLKVVGDIYDPPTDGSYPTTTRQLSIYYAQGVKVNLYSVDASGSTQGASNHLVDLAMYLFTVLKRNVAGTTPDVSTPILTSNLPTIASFCDQYSLHFNGIISESVNVIELLAESAPFFLLSFLSTGGQYRFAPVLPINGSQQINLSALSAAATFTEDEILPGSFSKTYVSAADKSDVNCILVYRQNNPDSIGTQQTVQVRYAGVSLDAPAEQFDMSDFCANRDHAIIYAKHYLARRRYSIHSVTFDIPLDTNGLIPTDIVKIQRQRITSTGDNRTEIEFYQITSIDHSIEGITTIEAAQFPVNGSNVPIISNEVVNGSFTVV